MRTMRTAWLALTALGVVVSAGVSSAQTAESTSPPIEVGGFRLEGYGEAGVRFFGERPTQKESAKFEEYRDINQGLYLQGLWLRFFTPDEKYSGVITTPALTSVAKPAATYELKDQDTYSLLLRAQRNW